jgi:hypothetical protein
MQTDRLCGLQNRKSRLRKDEAVSGMYSYPIEEQNTCYSTPYVASRAGGNREQSLDLFRCSGHTVH